MLLSLPGSLALGIEEGSVGPFHDVGRPLAATSLVVSWIGDVVAGVAAKMRNVKIFYAEGSCGTGPIISKLSATVIYESS
jgi:hypothetical protein